MADSILPIDASQIPADVRKDGAKGEQLYATALQFESVLTEQLAQAIVPQQDGDSSTGEDGSSSLYAQMLPQAFSQGVTGAGGLGLARQLYEALKQS
jgi:Rod binding domain-containing protein